MKAKRILKFVSIAILLLLFVAVFLGWFTLRRSLPVLDGKLTLPNLSSDVQIVRDHAGVPRITAKSRRDAAAALGFVHGQDRFFQMDLMRRMASGRLAELFGDRAMSVDERFRIHRFAQLAEQIVDQWSDEDRSITISYTEGVNAGLAAQKAKPFEYFLLGEDPEPWKVTDCLLVTFAMYCDLQDERGRDEYSRGLLAQTLPPEVFRFIARDGTPWDAPIVGDISEQPQIPPAGIWKPKVTAHIEGAERTIPGSNNFAVDGTLTADGRAILASDMHLGHAVPNIWYRAVMDVPAFDQPDRRVRLVGVTLPGTMALICGSNGSVAWAYTNSYGDYGDMIKLKMADEKTYMTADGPLPLKEFKEVVHSKSGLSHEVTFKETIWGPVVHESPRGGLFVHRWVARDVEGTNLNLLRLESVTDLSTALDVANTCGIPGQNFVCVDRSGQIGWTIAGRIPDRGMDPPRVPQDWSTGVGVWRGYVAVDDTPRVANPVDHRIWTANARVTDRQGLSVIGDGGYDLAGRAQQIRNLLFESDHFSERDLLAIQLNDEARFLRPWHQLLLTTIESRPQAFSEAYRAFVANWGDHAATDSVGYRIVRGFRSKTHQELRTMFTQDAADRDPWFDSGSLTQFEGAVWQLITEQPPHFLPAGYKSWNEYLVAQATEVEAELKLPLKDRTWGERNRSAVEHPMASSIPLLGKYLNMPSHPLPGDAHMPRVQFPSFGASERMIVSPGHEEDGIFHMPGGQSGHPLSPYYRVSYEDWVEGRPSPLMPGQPEHTITLTPNN
ncbi:MAG: penicillin acylase family protein [Acidobacteria bacterium]|nr:penicillin acylase family protein [Acidobacteriota bacterium]